MLSNVTKESRREVVVLESLTQENSVTMLLLEKVIELSKPEVNALCVEEITEEEA